jgi:ribosomal-protein-alanine N-acetyltransferase
VSAGPPQPHRLETARLLLHPLAPADQETFHAINNDPGVARYLFDGRQITASESTALLDASRVLLARHGHGLFAVRLRDDGALIGWAGYLESGNPPVLEVAYALLAAARGHGFAVEATRAVMTWGARHLGMSMFHASVDAPNVASLRVLEKLAFRETGRSAGVAGDLVHFTLDATALDPSGVVCLPG